MRKVCLFEKEIAKVSLISVLSECGLGAIEFVRFKRSGDLKDCELLIIGEEMLDSLVLDKAISEFVYNGGICWIMHQGEKAKLTWLPKKLHKIKLQNRYFPVESGADNYVGPWITNCVTSLSNPIFVKKVEGPPGGYFYLLNEAPPYFEPARKRWMTNFTRINKVKFQAGIWEIELFEPSVKGKLHLGWKEVKTVRIDGKEVRFEKDTTDEIIVKFPFGLHRFSICSRGSSLSSMLEEE